MASATTPDLALANLQATALTARCHNVFFRQKQLKSLHDTLRNNVSSIRDAIKQDTRTSDAEATAEVALSLDIVKEHYSSLDPKKELEEEYRITNKKNASDRRLPWGVVYVEPQRNHTPFFSVIVVVSSALAAGNCVTLKVILLLSRSNQWTKTICSSRMIFALYRLYFESYSMKLSKPTRLPLSPRPRPQTRYQTVYKSFKRPTSKCPRTRSLSQNQPE
jgi:hypothetical protein